MDFHYLNKFTVNDMKACLRKYGAPVSGTKLVLFQRIKELKKAVQKGDVVKKKKCTLKSSSSSSLPAKRSPKSAKTEKVIQLGIVPSCLENNPLSLKQTDLIKEAIINVAINLKDEDGARPNFTESIKKLGWMIIHCSDSATADWMRRNFEKIKQECKLDVNLVEKDEFPNGIYACGLFPESFELTNEKILATISAQNANLSTKYWNVFRRDKEGDLLHLGFFIDLISASLLKVIDKQIGYRFGQITLSIKFTMQFSGTSTREVIDEENQLASSKYIFEECNPKLMASKCLSCSKLFKMPATKDK